MSSTPTSSTATSSCAARAPGERLAALNGKTYALDDEMTVIADDSGVLSLGGVIGGESSGCTEATRNVFIESALFDPARTAATGRKLAIESDARYRFERGIDPEFARPGIEIATRLMLELCGGEPSAIASSGAVPDWRRRIELAGEPGREPGRRLDLPAADQRGILEALGCTVFEAATSSGSSRRPGAATSRARPIWSRRCCAFAATRRSLPCRCTREGALPKPALSPAQRRVGFVRRALASRGLVEAVTFSFMAKGHAALFGGGSEALTLANPISADLDQMRPSVLPNLLAAAQRNADRGFPNGALYEIGPLYRDDTAEGQWQMATGIRTGRTGVKRWDDPGRDVDALLAKADAGAALQAAGVPADGLQVSADPPSWYHPGRAGTLRQGANALAHFGELHPGVLAALGVAAPAVGFEVFLDRIPAPRARQGKARPLLSLSAFQPVERDFAFVVAESVAADSLLRAARGVDKKLVADVRLFDVYRGKGLEAGTKSLAITVVLQPTEETLTDAAIEAFSSRLVAAVEKATGGKLRA